ncbi:hypothetical protein DL764_000200 [Monosporascus ibericus]|uniref:Uncharacterized protein n=1 Tax=Monosporascus ibericus TaxID=155417 RepID=A0A4Q4TX79_9PEZI|nr:hypothetical protein DL764_000200 [Monosporascus ibericus]
MVSIVMSGLVFGILVARLLSGIVTEYTSWRNIYWVSFDLLGRFSDPGCLRRDALVSRSGHLGVPGGSWQNTIVVASRMAIANVDPTAQNAVNAVYMVCMFCGELFGTAAGNALYAKGGWTHSGALNIAQMVAGMLTIIARGPHEKGWVRMGKWLNLKDKKVEEKTRTLGGVSDIEANDPVGAGGAEHRHGS